MVFPRNSMVYSLTTMVVVAMIVQYDGYRNHRRMCLQDLECVLVVSWKKKIWTHCLMCALI